ncbi:MAG TPA: alpha/beta fold hydrolase [Vicinamibacterales bacterium]
MIRSSRAIVALLLLLWASPAVAAGLPVLFIHGFCSSADTWDGTLPQISTRRYGYDAPRVYENANGKAAARTLVQAGSRTFRIDFSDLAGGFDPLAVADVPIARKAGELKVVIDAIKQFTGAPAVILVGHSLGGLAARSYMQGAGHDRNNIPIPYGRDVAALIMIDTPNQGSRLAFVSGFPKQDECILADTVNLRELQPTSRFLRELNRRTWPAWAAVHSIISSNAGTDSDDVVNTTSQDLTALQLYALLPEARRWVQTFERNGVLHLRVHNEATTVSLFTGIISDLDGK